MNRESLERERDLLRDKWSYARNRRLELKNVLTGKESSIIEIRHNPEYKRLKKEQKNISKMIKHIEKKIAREIKNEA